MSDDELDDEFQGDVEAPKKFAGKKLVLFIVLPILLLVGAGAGVMMSGLLGSGEPDEVAVAATGRRLRRLRRNRFLRASGVAGESQQQEPAAELLEAFREPRTR